MKPFEIASACLFAIGLMLFALAGLLDFSYWLGASIATVGLIALLAFVALRPREGGSATPSPIDSEDHGIEEVHLMPHSTRTIKCPRCGEPTEVGRGEKPSCANCGFS